MPEDLGKLIERLLAQGERVVIVGRGEPMVLLPLAEYEQLKGFPSDLPAGETAASGPHLEPINPLTGAIAADNDQYFVEPL